MPTLREIAQQRGWNIDFDRLNQSGNDDGNAYRRQIFDMIGQQYNPYGTMGATALDPSGRAGEVDVSIIPDQLQGTQWEAIAQRLGAADAPALRGMLARGRGNELFRGDRGMYNEYAADLGAMKYDDALGWLPGEGGFQQGDRVGQSFSNMRRWGPAVVLSAGMLNNALGAGGLMGSGPPPLEGAPALGSGGASAASTAAQQALPGLTQAGINASGGAMIPGMSYGGGAGLLGGATDAAGAFDTGGWQGTGINGNTGTRGLFDRMAYNARGFINNPVGWAANNPVDAIRGVSSLYNLGSSIAGPRGNSNGSNRTGSKSEQGNQQVNIPQTQYHVNPITQAQLAQLYGGR